MEKDLLTRIHLLERQLALASQKVKQEDYGLIWMDVPESIEFEAANKQPILREIKGKSIINSDGGPTHLLIEGENYHGLSCLTRTHRKKIDLVYIDPPYNTGNEGFAYNDKRMTDRFPDGKLVPKDHPLRDSRWISFMYRRLMLARDLLKETGKIIISIDDHELAHLILLCRKIFGASNQVAVLPTIMNLKGNQDQFGFAGTHEYTIIFARNIKKCRFNEFRLTESELESWDEDEIGLFKKGAPLRATGEEDRREHRKEMFYPILVKNDSVSTISKEEHARLRDKASGKFNDAYLLNLIRQYQAKGYEVVLPFSGENYGRWRWGFSEVSRRRLETDVIVKRTKSGISLYKKQRPGINELPSKKPKTLFYKPEYSSGNGTAQIRDILGEKSFKNPKPVQLIKDLITLSVERNAIVLDFFAGAATTLQACLELNAEGFALQSIICTNNEGAICSEITYPRAKKVIKGYRNARGQDVRGLGNSLVYLRTSFAGRKMK